MNTASLHIRFNPLVKKIHNCSKCYLEIVPDVLDDEQLKKIYIKDDESTVQCSIPMEYKIILRKHTEKKNDEYSPDCDFDKFYHSCVDLIVTSSQSFSSIKDVKHKSETTLLDQIIADFASLNSEIIKDTNNKDNNKVQEINMIFNKSSRVKFSDLNTFSGKEPKDIDFNDEVYSFNKPYHKKWNNNLDSKQMQNTNKAFTKSNNYQNQKIKARCDNDSAESKVLSFSPMCSINTKDEIVYPVSYQVSRLKPKEGSNIFNYDHYINLNNSQQITKKKTTKNSNKLNNFCISNYSYTQRQSVEDRVSELIYLLKKEMLPLKLMLDETVRKSVAIGLSLGRGDVQTCKSLAWNTTVENPHCRLLQKCKPQIESNRVIFSSMDNELEPKEIARSLSFEVEAVPQDNRIQLTSSTNNSNPLNVKIKVRKKKGLESPQDAVLSIPKFGKTGSKPERIRLASSDQTIMSFNVFMEEADKKRASPKSKKKFFGLFKLGGNLDTDSCRSKSEDDILTDNVSDIDDDGTQSPTKDYTKGIFGKSKPGGCLDPPFGEDRYAYKARKNIQSTSTPYQAGTYAQETTLKELEPVIKTDSKTKLKSIDKKTSQEDDTVADKNTKTEKSSLLSLYQADTFKPSVEMSYSNSIITYPPPMTSSEMRALNEVNEKNMKNRSSIDRTSFQGPTDRYFGPKRDSSNRKSSKIEGIKGDKESMLLPEQTKYKLETKEHPKSKDNYLTQEIVKDAMLPVAGGLIVSTLLQSHSIDKPQKDKVIDIDKEKETYADKEDITKIKEHAKLEQNLPKKKDSLRSQMTEDTLLPAAEGLIASTLLPSHKEKKPTQDGTENIVLIETNKHVANENKEIPKIEQNDYKEIPKIEQNLPQQRDDTITEIKKDTMPFLSGNLIAPTLVESHTQDKLDQKDDIEANSAYINDTISHDTSQAEETKFEQNSTKRLPQYIQEQNNEENMHIIKNHYTPVTQSDQVTKINDNGASETRKIQMKQEAPENKILASTPMQSHSSIEKASATDDNEISVNKNIAKLKLVSDSPINKDIINEMIKDTKLPIAGDSEHSKTKNDYLTQEIVKDAMLPVAGGLIASTLLKSRSKDKPQKDKVMDIDKDMYIDKDKESYADKEKQMNTHDDSVTNIRENLKVDQKSLENEDYSTKEVLNDISPAASGLIASKVLQSNDRKEHSQIKDDYRTQEIVKDAMLPVAGGLIASTLLQSHSKDKPQKDKVIDIDKEKESYVDKEDITKIKENLKLEQIMPEKKDSIRNQMIEDTSLPASLGLIASTPLPSLSKKKLKQDETENIQPTETNKNAGDDQKEFTNIEQASPKQRDDYENKNLKDAMLPVAESLTTSTLMHPQSLEKLQQDDNIKEIISNTEDHAIKHTEIPKIAIDQSQAIQKTNKDEKNHVNETPSSILTKSPHVVATKSDETIKKNTNLNAVDNLTEFEENMDLNKDGDQTILEPDLITRHEKIVAVPASQAANNADNRLFAKDELAKKDVIYSYKPLDAEEVDSKIMINNKDIESPSILENKYKDHLVQDIQKFPLHQDYDPYNEDNLQSHYESVFSDEKQPKKAEPEPKDEQIALQKPHIALDSDTYKKSNGDLKFIRTSAGLLDERKEETKSISINNENLQFAPDKDLIFDSEDNEPENNLKPGEETLEDVTETRELVYMSKIKPVLKENSISPSQEVVVTVGPYPNLPEKGSEQNILLENDALNRGAAKEVEGLDIEKHDVVDFDSNYKSGARYESSQSFDDNSSKALKPLNFPFISKENIDGPTDKMLKEKTYENDTYSELTRPANEVVMLDLAFQTYINEENKRVFRSLDNSRHIERYNDDRISSIKASVETGGIEIRVPIDSDNDLSLSVQKRGNADYESKQLVEITPDSYAEMSESKQQLELSEENNDVNIETGLDNIQYALNKGLQPLQSELVTAEENPDEEEANLTTDYDEAGKQPQYKLITGHENLHEFELVPDLEKLDQPQANMLVTDYELLQQEPQLKLLSRNKEEDQDSKGEPVDEQLDQRQESQSFTLREEPHQQLQLKLATGGEKPDQRPGVMLVDRETSNERPELLRVGRDTQRSDLKLGLAREKPDQRPDMVLVTGHEKPGERPELLVRDTQRSDLKLDLVRQKPDQRPDMVLVTGREKPGVRPEPSSIGRETQWSDLKLVGGHEKTGKRSKLKLETGKEKTYQRANLKPITGRGKPDQLPALKLGKYLDGQTEKLGIESDLTIHGSDMFSLHHTLSSVYEKQLLPLQDLIKSLKKEIDSLSSQQALLRQNLVGVTKTKSMKVHVSKKCACRKF